MPVWLYYNMLEIMRSHKFFTVFLLSAVTIMIIVTFVFWGIGPKDTPSDEIVARIEKEKITQEEYWRVYENADRYYRETYKTEEEMKKLNLKDKVLNDLVEDRVLMIAAERNKIKVTDDELKEAIKSNPLFQKNGVFDGDVYLRALSINRMTPQMYENSIRQEIVLNKMHQLIAEIAELNAQEIKILDLIQDANNPIAGALISAKRQLVIKAYVEGLKRQMKIKINRKIIS